MGINTGGLHLSAVRTLGAPSQINGQENHLPKAPQRIMVRVFRLVKASQVKVDQTSKKESNVFSSHKPPKGSLCNNLHHYFAYTEENINMNGIKGDRK